MKKGGFDFTPGKILEEFNREKNSRKLHVIFRYPKMSDLDGILSNINATIRESEFLRMNKRITKEEERKWLKNTLKAIKEKKKIYIVAEINGRISGGGMNETKGGAASHVGEIGISLREKYTNMGIGTRMMEVMMNEAMKIGIEVLKISCYEHNKRAKHVYEKLGFKHIGTIPKARKCKDGSYSGEAIMYKILV